MGGRSLSSILMLKPKAASIALLQFTDLPKISISMHHMWNGSKAIEMRNRWVLELLGYLAVVPSFLIQG